jgi:hypothetical protein
MKMSTCIQWFEIHWCMYLQAHVTVNMFTNVQMDAASQTFIVVRVRLMLAWQQKQCAMELKLQKSMVLQKAKYGKIYRTCM